MVFIGRCVKYTDLSMLITGIRENDCIQCLKCVKACPSKLFTQQKYGSKPHIQFSDPYENCIQCGHCLAICPTNAISYSESEPPKSLPENWNERRPDYQTMLTLLRSKRSLRQFANTPLTSEEISQVVTAMQYSPSASNARQWGFRILTDPNKISFLSQKIVKSIRLTRSLVKNPIIRTCFLFGSVRKQVHTPGFIPSLDRIISTSERGEDPIFFKAPCVIILHSPAYGNLAGCDSGIALTYGMLAAETMGLGTCWIGIAQEAMQRLPGIRNVCGIPKGELPWGCFVLGHPNGSYVRLPPRAPVREARE